jgi:hypothetical protein
LREEHNDLVTEYHRISVQYIALSNLVARYSKAAEKMSSSGHITGGWFQDFHPWGLDPLSEPGDRRELDPAKIARYVDTLLRLRRITDPDVASQMYAKAASGDRAALEFAAHGPAFMKTQFADVAVCIAAELFRALTEWAIDHHVGIELVDPTESGLSEDPSTGTQGGIISDPWINDHRYELFGRTARWDEIAPRRAQLIAANLLNTLQRLYPREMTRRIAHAMKQVIVGSEAMLFRPTRRRKGKARAPLVRWTLRAMAVGHVRHRIALGAMKMEAIRMVAEAYGVPCGTLQGWENRLPDVFGHLGFQTLLYNARAEADQSTVVVEPVPTGTILPRYFSEEKLKRDGKLYRRYNSADGLSAAEVEGFFGFQVKHLDECETREL